MHITGTALGAIAAMLAQEAPQDPTPIPAPQDAPAEAQDVDDAVDEETVQPDPVPVVDEPIADDDGIVITAGRPRGSVVGDAEPIVTLDARDIAATGARSVEELLEALQPEIGSNRGRGGGRPVLLIDGRRISGFRELRGLPPEAIERMDILAEEVALTYGYSADQRVVNFVLRENFFSTTLETEMRAPTDGGRAGFEFEADRLMLSPGKRTTFEFEYETQGKLTENERDIALEPIETLEGAIDPRPFRTLEGSSEDLSLSTVIKRPLGEIDLTVNGELSEGIGQSLLGPDVARLNVPADSPFAIDGVDTEVLRATNFGALARDRRSRTGALAFILNSPPGDWLWSSNGTLDVTETRTRTDRGVNVEAIQADLDALDPRVSPFNNLAFGAPVRNEALSTSVQAVLDGQLSGVIADLPAGELRPTFRAGVNYLSIDSSDTISGIEEDVSLDRTRLFASANLDAPLLEDSPVGEIGIGFNGLVEELSDFGTLTALGGGVNWRPTDRLRLRVNYQREEGAPSLSQLGDPVTIEPLARVFDFTTGETVFIPVITGGNPDLVADTREVWSLGANWEVPIDNDDIDIDLRADFVSTRIDNPQGGFPSVSPEIEAAFPGRFVRDAMGDLVSVDFTPVNYAQSRRDSLRYGFSLRHTLEADPPSPETIQRFRERFARLGLEGQRGQRQQAANAQSEGRQGPPTPEGRQRPSSEQQNQSETRQQGENQQGQAQEGQTQEGQQSQQGQQQARGRRGGGGPGGFGGGRGNRGGRLWASVTHEINFTDELLIAEDGPLLDYLDGDALGGTGGRSRHTLEGRFGLFNNGWGARVDVDWYSTTRVDSGIGQLRFADYGTFDINLYANLGENLDLLSREPWLRGTSIQLGIDNVLNDRPKVTDEFGNVPPRYQADLLRPEGRVISLEIRKLFVPTRFIREQFQRMRGGS
ncbi:hypothetical protein WJT74_11365 [Sphingomicrobium sp. XHP0239]|uniref:hypothetical protein n=1 Tax=Sphingomicrobium maritimum TaxID=3133972 RepID=UPI0031CCC6B7